MEFAPNLIILGLALSFPVVFPPILLVTARGHESNNRILLLLTDRCPECKRLYSIVHVKKAQTSKYQMRKEEKRSKIGGSRNATETDIIETTTKWKKSIIIQI